VSAGAGRSGNGRRGRCRAVLVGVALTLAGCAVQAPLPPPAKDALPAEFPEAFYRQSAQARGTVFAIDPGDSLLVIAVRRGGSLAQLGHDHAIASHNLRGYVAPDANRADLFIRLDELVVDEPELRAQAGFDTQPNAAAIAGTRENMLAQLQAAEHAYAVIAVADVDRDAAGTWLQASIAVRGVTRAVRIPAQVEREPDELTVSGEVTLDQSSFGIAPLAILGGALSVQDRVDVRFRIHARRLPG
jgi:hypothetical protein